MNTSWIWICLTLEPFHSHDLASNSSYCLPYNLLILLGRIKYWINLRSPKLYSALFSSLFCLILYWFDVEKFFLGTHRSKRVKILLGLPSHGNLSGSLDEYLIDKLTLVLGQCWLRGWKKWYSYFVCSGSSLTCGVLDM